jgi:site-specific recombinase XerD
MIGGEAAPWKVIDSARDLVQRTILTVLYSTGARRAELVQIKVADVDSQRMVIRIRHGKGGHDRDVPLSEKLLEALRQYWRWMKPKTWLFPGLAYTARSWRFPTSADTPQTNRSSRSKNEQPTRRKL